MSLRVVSEYHGPGRLLYLASEGRKPPVLLTHGTFSDAETCMPLAGFLAQAGHPVYVIEWRGRHGRPGRFDFHDLAEGEITFALAYLSEPVHLLAHSGGGLAMALAICDPAFRNKVRSLTMLATQGTHLTEARRLPYLGIRALERFGRLRGHWPARLLGLGSSNESAALLSQWLAFNRARRITDRNGRDIFPRLAELDLPVLALAGAADNIIARPEGCFALVHAFGPRAQTHLCAVDTDSEDFTHARLFKSRAAAAHVWPRITAFMDALE